MRLPLLMSAGVLLMALLPCPPCRAFFSQRPASDARQTSQHPLTLDFVQPQPEQPQQPEQPEQPELPKQPEQHEQPEQPQQPQQPQPVLFRIGEEYFLRLGNLNKSPAAPLLPASSSLAGGSRPLPEEATTNFFRALLPQLPLPRRSLNSPGGTWESGAGSALSGHQVAPERKRQSEEPPISLDLTFHLLREVLEMARAQQLAEQAHNNRKLMDIIGK